MGWEINGSPSIHFTATRKSGDDIKVHECMFGGASRKAVECGRERLWSQQASLGEEDKLESNCCATWVCALALRVPWQETVGSSTSGSKPKSF